MSRLTCSLAIALALAWTWSGVPTRGDAVVLDTGSRIEGRVEDGADGKSYVLTRPGGGKITILKTQVASVERSAPNVKPTEATTAPAAPSAAVRTVPAKTASDPAPVAKWRADRLAELKTKLSRVPTDTDLRKRATTSRSNPEWLQSQQKQTAQQRAAIVREIRDVQAMKPDAIAALIASSARTSPENRPSGPPAEAKGKLRQLWDSDTEAMQASLKSCVPFDSAVMQLGLEAKKAGGPLRLTFARHNELVTEICMAAAKIKAPPFDHDVDAALDGVDSLLARRLAFGKQMKTTLDAVITFSKGMDAVIAVHKRLAAGELDEAKAAEELTPVYTAANEALVTARSAYHAASSVASGDASGKTDVTESPAVPARDTGGLPWPKQTGQVRTCPGCGGTGFDDEARRLNAEAANRAFAPGSGRSGKMRIQNYCSTCGGKGQIAD